MFSFARSVDRKTLVECVKIKAMFMDDDSRSHVRQLHL